MEPITEKYIDQTRLYNVVGQEILSNAWYYFGYLGMVITAVFLLMGRLVLGSRIL